MKHNQPNSSFSRAALMAFLVAVSFALLAACATTTAVRDSPAETPSIRSQAGPIQYPEYNGAKTPLVVLPLGLSQRAAQRYPHLLDASVGMGLHNVLSDELYRSGRFRLVEANEAVVKKVFEQQWLSATGAVDQEHAVEMGKVLGAKKVIYGEVYDYSEGKDEKVVGLSVKSTPRVRVGVQIRLVDVETLEYQPASGTATGLDWMDSSEQAVQKAVYKLVQ